jgi:hypothetical protein
MLPADALHGCRTHCQTGKILANVNNIQLSTLLLLLLLQDLMFNASNSPLDQKQMGQNKSATKMILKYRKPAYKMHNHVSFTSPNSVSSSRVIW